MSSGPALRPLASPQPVHLMSRRSHLPPRSCFVLSLNFFPSHSVRRQEVLRPLPSQVRCRERLSGGRHERYNGGVSLVSSY